MRKEQNTITVGGQISKRVKCIYRHECPVRLYWESEVLSVARKMTKAWVINNLVLCITQDFALQVTGSLCPEGIFVVGSPHQEGQGQGWNKN